MENLVEPTDIRGGAEASYGNERVYTAKEQIEACLRDKRRIEKIEALKEDRDIMNQQDARLIEFKDKVYDNFRESPTPPLMKSSLYMQAFRKFYSENFDLSRVSPRKKVQDEGIVPFLEAIKDQVITDGDLQGHQVEVLKAKFTDGVVFSSIGFGEVVEPSVYKYENTFWDITSDVMRKAGKASNKACKYFGVRSTMSRGDFEDFLESKKRKDLLGKVSGGDYIGTQETEEDMDIEYNDPVIVYTFWSIRKGKAFKTIFAGSNGVEIEYFDNDNYPNKFRGEYYIPVTCRVADASQHVFTSNSYIGMFKDGAEAIKKILNTFYLSIPRTVNPWQLLVGDENGEMSEDLKLFNAISDIGGTPIISTASADVDIKSISPQSVVQEVTQARDIILDEIGSKMGIQFRIQEKTNQRASIFLEQRKDESEASQMQKKIDKRAVEELIEYSVHLTIEHGEPQDLFVDFGKDGAIESKVREGKFIHKILAKWDGYFEADITIEEELSTPQKIAASDNVQVSIDNLYAFIAQVRPESVEEIMPRIDLLNQKIMHLKQDKDVTRAELISMFSAFIDRQNGEQQQLEAEQEALQAQSVPAIPENGVAGEVGQEVPQAVQNAL